MRRCCSPRETVSAVLASSAIPAVLPPVRRDGRTLVDGGLADNAAISQAIALGADRIYVLPTGYACALPSAPTRPLAVAVQALSLLPAWISALSRKRSGISPRSILRFKTPNASARQRLVM